MSFDQRPTFSFADQAAADDRALARQQSLLDLLPESDPGEADALTQNPEPEAAPRDVAPVGR